MPSTAGAAGKSSVPDGGIFIDGDVSGPPTCGGQTLQAITHPPLLYFVIDRSGSMGDAFDSFGKTKYGAALTAIGQALHTAAA